MRDIRRSLYQYLEAKRHLWNTYFVDAVRNLSECEPLESFEAIDRRLFYALVCQPLGIPFDFGRKAEEVESIVVRPRAALKEITLIVSKTAKGQWNAPEHFPASGLSFVYKEFFQWNAYQYLSLAQVKCKIAEFPPRLEYVGRDALIDHDLVDFWLDD